MTWPAIILLFLTILACACTSGCVTRHVHVHPISERIIVVPLEPTTKPATRPNLIPRNEGQKPA